MTDEDRDFYRWYGPWRPLMPRGVARLMRGSNITWISVRDDGSRIPIDDATFSVGGIRYLRPEIVLWMKAKWERPKDDLDLAQILSRLDVDRTAWLREVVAQHHPGHRWLRLLDA